MLLLNTNKRPSGKYNGILTLIMLYHVKEPRYTKYYYQTPIEIHACGIQWYHHIWPWKFNTKVLKMWRHLSSKYNYLGHIIPLKTILNHVWVQWHQQRSRLLRYLSIKSCKGTALVHALLLITNSISILGVQLYNKISPWKIKVWVTRILSGRKSVPTCTKPISMPLPNLPRICENLIFKIFQRGALRRAVERVTSDYRVPGSKSGVFHSGALSSFPLIARRPVRRSFNTGY